MEWNDIKPWIELVFRWLHVVAGIMWIGHLWFFNFVNSQFVKAYDADSKKKLLPELMPRALYWFRWGAAYTFITGVLLVAFVYYMGGNLINAGSAPLSNGAASGVSLAVILVPFVIYDMLWKTSLAKNETVAAAISLVLFLAIIVGLGRVFSGRAVFIHAGGILGTIMAANVWMRIWPNQKKIISGVSGKAAAPDASVAAVAGLRSKHNTYMSIPLVLFMISTHFYTNMWGLAGSDHDLPHDFGWLIVGVFMLAGWGLAKFLYTKAASDAPKAY